MTKQNRITIGIVIGLLLIVGGHSLFQSRHTITNPSQQHNKKINSTEPAANNNQMKITVNNRTIEATMADNSSAKAFLDWLDEGDQTLTLEDFEGMEKVGNLHKQFPTNDTPTNTEAGDFILYQGNKFVMYYGHNSWNFTRLGKMEGISATELKQLLGRGKVTVTLEHN